MFQVRKVFPFWPTEDGCLKFKGQGGRIVHSCTRLSVVMILRCSPKRAIGQYNTSCNYKGARIEKRPILFLRHREFKQEYCGSWEAILSKMVGVRNCAFWSLKAAPLGAEVCRRENCAPPLSHHRTDQELKQVQLHLIGSTSPVSSFCNLLPKANHMFQLRLI